MTKKKQKPAPIEATPEDISKAAKTNAIRELVQLADAFSRVSLFGPFELGLPLFCHCYIGGDKKFRKSSIKLGTKFNADSIKLGKRDGLIFVFRPAAPLKRDGGEETIQWIEIGWDDVINHLATVVDKMEEMLVGKLGSDSPEVWKWVRGIDERIKAAVGANPSMHKILSEGFALAQKHSREEAKDEKLEQIEGWGAF